MRSFLSLTVVAIAACTGVATVEEPAQTSTPSISETKLRALMTAQPRRGALMIEDKALHLRIQRGDRTVPFMSVARSTFDLGCHIPPNKVTSDDRTDVWWMFSGDGEAVALQFTTHEVALWMWDAARDCPVTMNALDTPQFEVTPPHYYKAEDAQVAYRWNHNFTPRGQLDRTRTADAPIGSGITSGGDEDVLPDVEGVETLIVERDYAAVRASDGRTLLQKQFEIDPDWPCYRAEITVLGNPTTGFYAVASFETFGTFTDCEVTSGDTRFQSEIFDWDPRRELFVSSFATTEQRRALHPTGEDSRTSVLRNVIVDGGTLRIQRASSMRYLSGDVNGCWQSSSSTTRATRFDLLARDGATVALGETTDWLGDHDQNCGSGLP